MESVFREMFMGSAFKKMALLICGIAASILVGALSLGSGWPTPGVYVVHWIYPPGAPGPAYDAGPVLFTYIGTNSICCFAALSLAYALLTKSRRKK